ncbi:MAG: hypothetical protein V4668_03700 [Patescibacteria group bacterium]
MNPNNNEIVSTLPEDSLGKQPHPVNQITPVSKYLALALFIILPFLGAYIGYQLAPERVVEVLVENLNTEKDESSAVNSTETLLHVPVDAQHILFEERKTGYFIHNDKVYLAETTGTENLANDEWDWIVEGKPTLMPDADAATFKVISAELAQTGSLYAIDTKRAYSFDKVLPKVDIASVEVFGQGGAFLLSNDGLYIGDRLITGLSNKNLEIYVMKLSEGMSSFNIYIHNLENDLWLKGGFGVETKEISAPKNSDLTAELKLYPIE